jgi:hypothetical protein
LKDELAIHISFNAAILQYALENWPRRVIELRQEGKKGAYFYQDSVYQKLGLRA